MNVSVLIPTSNYGCFLAEAVESVLGQTYKDISVTIVDDGSTDDTAAVAARYPGVKYVYIPHRGVGAARNEALKYADGEYVAFIDADDRWAPEKLSKQIAYMEAHPDCRIVFTGVRNFTDIPEDQLTEKHRAILNAPVPKCLPSALIRRDIFEEYGGFEENMPRGEDTDWIVRLTRGGVDLSHTIGEELYFRRVHNSNTLVQNPYGRAQTMRFFADMIRKRGMNRVTGIQQPERERPCTKFEKLSVIIPVFNGEKYIREAIRSVREQMPDAEIIVADDGSSDGSAAAAAECGAMVLKKENGGAASARNLALKHATGTHVYFIDADDVAVPGGIAALTEQMEKENAHAVCGMTEDFVSPDLPEEEAAKLMPRKEPYSGLMGAYIIEKALVDELGGFNENLQTGETVDFFLKLKLSGAKTASVGQTVVKRRLHMTNTGRLQRAGEMKNYAAILRQRLTGRE